MIGTLTMDIEPTAHFRWFLEDGVAVVEVLTRELNNPYYAEEFGAQLQALVASRASDRILLNFQHTKSLSSTTCAALFKFARAASGAGVRVVACGMDPVVRMGADIASLDEFIPIFDDEPTARAALQ